MFDLVTYMSLNLSLIVVKLCKVKLDLQVKVCYI